MKKSRVEVTTTSNTDAQQVNTFSLILLHHKRFLIHCGLRISIRMLRCIIVFLDAMITIRERLLSREWC